MRLVFFASALVAGSVLIGACSSEMKGKAEAEPATSAVSVVEPQAMSQNGYSLFQSFDGDLIEALECARSSQTSLVVAHRGGAAPGYPENAIKTVERAVSSLPVIVEVDVWHLADGANILHHDEHLDRTTTGSGLTSDSNWNDLKELRLVDNGFVRTEEAVADLGTFFETYGGKAFVLLDMKNPHDSSEIVQSMKAQGLNKSIAYISYNIEQALEIQAADPDAVLALGASGMDDVFAFGEAGLLSSPIIALSGGLGQWTETDTYFRANGHYVLKGTYYGSDPIDARVEAGQVDVLTADDVSNVQLIVSNRPFDMYSAIMALDVPAVPSCD